MKTVAFEYDIGDEVSIVGFDNIAGFIISLQFQDCGIEYEVVYYLDSKRERSNFFPVELSPVKKKKIGFAKGK